MLPSSKPGAPMPESSLLPPLHRPPHVPWAPGSLDGWLGGQGAPVGWWGLVKGQPALGLSGLRY